MGKKECLLLVKNTKNLSDIIEVLNLFEIEYDTQFNNIDYDVIISDYKHNYKANNLILISPKPYDKEDVLKAYKANIILSYQFYDFVDWLNLLNGYFIQNKSKAKLINEVNSIKLVSRAKGVLMDYLGMSEQQAHHFIEKRAMDNQVTKEVISKEIIKTYG